MPRGRKPESNTSLTRGEKRWLDRALHNLTFYMATPEGADTFERLEQLYARIQNRAKLDRLESLTPQEATALNFIQREVKKGKSPTVREVTSAIKLRSPRSGHCVIKELLKKGIVIRTNDGLQITL
jgi:hypothetical protein